MLALAALDRMSAGEDRRKAGAQRVEAALDREVGLADRVAGAGRRDGSRVDRGASLEDRGAARADRVAGVRDRDLSGLDRGTSLDDRVGGASDRNSSGRDRGISGDDRAASANDRVAKAGLEAAKIDAERANAAKDAFLLRLGHELRTPLNAVQGFAQLLELDPVSPKRDIYVAHILRGGRHLLRIIDDMLDIAAIDSDRLTATSQTVNIFELIDGTLPLMQSLAEANGIVLRYDRQGAATPSHLKADPHRLRQVLVNLLSNAIKYNRPRGSVSIEVHGDVDTETGAGSVSISVIDTGLGIPAVDLPRLFTAFDRLGRQSTGIEGTGIGLMLSKRLVTLMEGRLEVETTEGKGSTFMVTLPGVRDSSRKSGTSAAAELKAGGGGKRSTVLYIEDDRSNRELLAEMIDHKAHWTITSATTGKSGLESARAHPPTAIVLDMHLPDIDGADVLHLLKSSPITSDIPVAMLSAEASPNQIDRLLAAGAKSYLVKPLKIQSLFDFLDTTSDTTGSAPGGGGA